MGYSLVFRGPPGISRELLLRALLGTNICSIMILQVSVACQGGMDSCRTTTCVRDPFVGSSILIAIVIFKIDANGNDIANDDIIVSLSLDNLNNLMGVTAPIIIYKGSVCNNN